MQAQAQHEGQGQMCGGACVRACVVQPFAVAAAASVGDSHFSIGECSDVIFTKGSVRKVFDPWENGGNGTVKIGYFVPFFSHSPPISPPPSKVYPPSARSIPPPPSSAIGETQAQAQAQALHSPRFPPISPISRVSPHSPPPGDLVPG